MTSLTASLKLFVPQALYNVELFFQILTWLANLVSIKFLSLKAQFIHLISNQIHNWKQNEFLSAWFLIHNILN